MASSSNVLIFGDLHLHSHKRSADRLEDCVAVLEWVFRTATDAGVGDVLFLGDLFHDRTKIEVLTLHRVFEVFERHFGGGAPFNLRLLLGNHDLWHRDRWDVHSPVFLKAFDGVTVIDRPCTLNVQGHNVDFLPFTENPVRDLDALRSLVPRDQGERRLLCSHLAVAGARISPFTHADVVVEHDGEMVRMGAEMLAGWDHVYLGHYHGEQTLGVGGGVEYVGSPLELTFSEAGQEKHLVLHDLDTSRRRYVVNDFSPRHLVLRPEQLAARDLSGHFVTVVAPRGAGAAELADIRQGVARNHAVGSLQIVQRRPEPDDAGRQAVLDARGILESQDRMIERFVAECPPETIAGLDPGVLTRLGRRIVERQGDEDVDFVLGREMSTDGATA